MAPTSLAPPPRPAPPIQARFLGPATVDAVASDARSVSVILTGQAVVARMAAAGYSPAAGDEVLVLGDQESGFYVIGLLSAAEGGADGRQQPQLVHDAERGCTRLAVERGDLELVAVGGNIRLVAGGGIDLTGFQPVDIRSRVAVRLSIFDRLSGLITGLGITRSRTELGGKEVRIDGDDVQVTARQARLASEQMEGDFERVSVNAGRARLTVGRLLSKAGEVIHRVTGLWQLSAERTRTVVEQTSHHKAGRIYTRAVEDVKIDGTKIHLG